MYHYFMSIFFCGGGGGGWVQYPENTKNALAVDFLELNTLESYQNRIFKPYLRYGEHLLSFYMESPGGHII